MRLSRLLSTPVNNDDDDDEDEVNFSADAMSGKVLDSATKQTTDDDGDDLISIYLEPSTDDENENLKDWDDII